MNKDSGSQQYTILHLGKFYPPHSGGIETHVEALALRESKRASVSVLVANHRMRTESSILQGVRVTRLARWGSVASMPLCPGLTRAICERPTDLVHLHTPNPGAAFSFLRSRHPGRLVITHHADTVGRKILRRLSDPYAYRAMQRAAAIIVTSSRYLDSSAELRDFREKCRVIPLGIEPEEVSFSAEPEAGSARLNRSDQQIILAVGRLVPYKGFDVLIRAMKHITGTLILIGSGPQEAQLRMLAEREGVIGRIRMPGRVEDLNPYFRAASLFVLPSITRAEAFGIVQLEAMAAGLPVVNTNIDSGVPEVSVGGETGLTVEPSDVLALAGAIQTLLDDPVLCERYSRAARNRVLQQFTADRMADCTFQLYREILESSD